MKKIFALMFVFSLICPSIFAENIADNEMRNQIAQTVEAEIADDVESGFGCSTDYDVAGELVYTILFQQDITTEGDKFVSNPAKDCVAVAIDDSWAVASKKCILSVGNKISPLPGKVKSVSTSNFKIVVNGRAYPVENYNKENLIILRTVNENGTPLLNLDFKPKLTYASSIFEDFFKKDFSKGTFEVNRTDKHTATHDDGQHGSWEDNFYSYYNVGRTTYPKTIKSLEYKESEDRIFVRVSKSWIAPKELRAGDPLFYVENGRRHLLGFGYATNLWDNFDGSRTDKVYIFDYSDIRDIFETVRSVDKAAEARIVANLVRK